jgi:monofunctional biosynthetic peptidoglycan transglycosylase
VRLHLARLSGRQQRFARRLGLTFIAIAAIPLVMTPIYALVPPVSTLMLWSGVTGGGMHRNWVGLDHISPSLVNSVLMSEDARFCMHHGVDWQELDAVLDSQGGPSRGASTIPMQMMKNLFLWQSRSYVRKGLEIPLAYYGDFILSKRRIAEIYLNIAEWGPGLFGAEAASQFYFRRSASQLTTRQAALLAAALPNPIIRNPAKPSRKMLEKARIIEGRARAAGDYVGCI